MLINRIFFIFFLFQTSFLYSQVQLIPYKENGKVGFKDKEGKTIISPKYDTGEHSQGDLAIVSINGKYGFINLSGKEVIALDFDNCHYFREKKAAVKQNGKWGFIDAGGKQLISCVYDSVAHYGFEKGMVAVQYHGKWGMIGANGKTIIDFQYDEIGYLTNDGLILARQNNKYGYLDAKGKVQIPFTYDYAESFYDGLAQVCNDTLCGAINSFNQPLIPLQYAFADVSYKFFIPVVQNRKIAIYSRNGLKLTEPVFDEIGDEFSNYLFVYSKDMMGLLDNSGTILIEPSFEDISVLEYGDLLCTHGYMSTVYSLTYKKFLFPPIACYISDNADGYLINCNEKTGFINKDGKEIVPATYDYIEINKKHQLEGWKDGTFYLFNLKGELLTR